MPFLDYTLDTLRFELDDGSRYWYNTRTDTLFYLCAAEPMKSVSKIPFNVLRIEGFLVKNDFDDIDEFVECYVSKTYYKTILEAAVIKEQEEHQQQSLIRWLSN